jgi:hypothetical protein
MHWTYVWNIPRALQHPTWKESFPSLQKVARSIRELLDCIYLEWVWMVQRISVSIRIKPATMASWFIDIYRIRENSSHHFPVFRSWILTSYLHSAQINPMAIGLFRTDDLHCIVPCNGGKKMKKGPWWPWTPWGIGTQGYPNYIRIRSTYPDLLLRHCFNQHCQDLP